MKANHIPTHTRLQWRINALSSKLEDCWTKESGRFYQFCRHCGLDVISVNMNGHAKGCTVNGVEKEIVWYKELLNGLT